MGVEKRGDMWGRGEEKGSRTKREVELKGWRMRSGRGKVEEIGLFFIVFYISVDNISVNSFFIIAF